MTGSAAPVRPGPPPATTAQQWGGAAFDVALLGLLVGVTWWLGHSLVLVVLLAVEALVVLLLVFARSGRTPGTALFGSARVRRDSLRAPGLGAGLWRTRAVDLRRDAWQRAERHRTTQQADRLQPVIGALAWTTPNVATAPRVPAAPTAPTAPSPWSPVPIPSPAPTPPEERWQLRPAPVTPCLVLPAGERVPVDLTLYVGRSPRVSAPDARSVPLPDAPQTLSRTHLVLAPADGDGVWVEDVSAHGTELRHPSGDRQRLAPGERIQVQVGTRIMIPGVLLKITAG
ncbi:MAG: FHA domain-containing protein [Propionibacteriaceae bacterium]|nr:FHA domain-containing protein [Propionibacteriaceae bacterium]